MRQLAAVPCLFALLGLAACSGDGTLTSDRGTLAGYVFAADGSLVLRGTNEPGDGETAVSGAQVSVGTRITTTSSSGFWTLSDISTGLQTVRVSNSGALSVSATATVVANQTTYVGTGGGSPADRRWLVLLYATAEDEDEAEAIDLINSLEAVGSSDTVSVVAQLDRGPGNSTASGDWTGARRFLVEEDDDDDLMSSARIVSEGGVAEDLGELDQGDPAVLREFVTGAIADYPATRVALVLWGQGTGWRPYSVTRSFGVDQSSALEPAELHTALTGTGLHLLAFDAPFMQQMEILYELRADAGYIVGSPGALPDDRLPLATWVQALKSNSSQTAADAAESLVNRAVTAYSGSAEVAVSAVRAEAVAELARRLDKLAEQLATSEPTEHDLYGTAREAALAYGGSSLTLEGVRDLGHLTAELSSASTDAVVIARAAALLTDLNNAVLLAGHTGSGMADSTGIAIDWPSRANWFDGVGGEPAAEESYGELDLTGYADWAAFVNQFAEAEPAE